MIVSIKLAGRSQGFQGGPPDRPVDPAIEEMAHALGLSGATPALTQVLGPNAIRASVANLVDHYLGEAAEAATWGADWETRPQDSLRFLVDAVLANAGYCDIVHPDRAAGARLRSAVIRALTRAARSVGRETLRQRAAIVASALNGGYRRVPVTAEALVSALIGSQRIRMPGPLELDVSEDGKAFMLEGRDLMYMKTDSKGEAPTKRRITLQSEEGRLFASRLVEGMSRPRVRAEAVTHLRAALKDTALSLEGTGEKLRVEPSPSITPELQARLPRRRTR